MKTEIVPVSRKVLMLENIFFIIWMAFVCAYILFSVLDRELLLGSLVIDPRILFYLGLSSQTVYVGFTRKRSPKPKSGKTAWRICLIATVVLILLAVGSITSDIKNTIAEKELTLSDGKKVLMIENQYEDRFFGTYKYIKVYQKGFLSSIELGKIDEYYFSNACLLQNKYSYDYDAQSKILTIHCKYGAWGDETISLVHDTGTISNDFQVK